MMEKLQKQISETTGGPQAVGKILLKLCAGDDWAAEIVEQDLENPDMSLEDCFGSLEEVANKKQSGGCYYMDQEETEHLIRKFYGIPEGIPEKSSVVTAPQAPSGIMDITDLMEM